MKRITADSPVSKLFPVVDWLTKHYLTVNDVSVYSRKKYFCKYFCVEYSDVDEILTAINFLMGGNNDEK